VGGLPDGGFVTTNFLPRRGTRDATQRMLNGELSPRRDEIPLGFRVGNIHVARDNTLWAAGQAGHRWKAMKIDPITLAVREVLNHADTPEFGAGAADAEVGDDLWIGSFRGNRIAIVPAP
jgi:hypothetical protein